VVEKAIIIYENDKCHTKLLDHPIELMTPRSTCWRRERERGEKGERERGREKERERGFEKLVASENKQHFIRYDENMSNFLCLTFLLSLFVRCLC
jgi:hypothetical protein